VNLPNKLTVGRLLLTLVFFILLMFDGSVLGNTAFIVFVVAALTDLLDGWAARKYGLVTDFGRVADPFADKILICGGLVFLLSKPNTPVADWMVVVILAREFLVSGMRSLAESRGIPFGATYWGKFKALSQIIAIAISIIYIANRSLFANDPYWVRTVAVVALYIATAMTAISGIVYVARARRILHLDT